jgi:hypothetical protein
MYAKTGALSWLKKKKGTKFMCMFILFVQPEQSKVTQKSYYCVPEIPYTQNGCREQHWCMKNEKNNNIKISSVLVNK